MIIAIDENTLPVPGKKLKFRLYPELWLTGEYDNAERLFIHSEEEYYDVWLVHEWEYLD